MKTRTTSRDIPGQLLPCSVSVYLCSVLIDAPVTLPNKRGGIIHSGTVHCICTALCPQLIHQSVSQSVSPSQSERYRPPDRDIRPYTLDTHWHWASRSVADRYSTQYPSFYSPGRPIRPCAHPIPKAAGQQPSPAIRAILDLARVELCLTGLLSVPPAHSTRLGSSIHRPVHPPPRPSAYLSTLPCSTPTTGFSATATAHTPCRQNLAQSCRTVWRSWTRN